MYKFSDQKEGKETVFTIKNQDLKFGVGALRELWSDAKTLEMKRIALFLDPNIRASNPIGVILESSQSTGLEINIYDEVVCEPNTTSCMVAADFVKQGEYDGIVSIGNHSACIVDIPACLFQSTPNEACWHCTLSSCGVHGIDIGLLTGSLFAE